MASLYRSSANADEVRDWCRERLARWTVPHETHVIGTSCGQTHVVSAGEGDRICVYLPGTNFNAATSTLVLGTLASRCVVYAADLPGQPGLSASMRPDDEESRYAGWVRDLIGWVTARHIGGRLIAVRPSVSMLRATVPWLVRRNAAGSRRLLDYMSGPIHAPADEVVEWMTLVARACRSTGAPGPLPDDILMGWRGHHVQVAVGDHDAFFPPRRLGDPCRNKLRQEPVVVRNAGHLLVDEEPAIVTDLVIS